MLKYILSVKYTQAERLYTIFCLIGDSKRTIRNLQDRIMSLKELQGHNTDFVYIILNNTAS